MSKTLIDSNFRKKINPASLIIGHVSLIIGRIGHILAYAL